MEESDVIQNELGICDGIAIDSVARNIYWTDDGADRIEVSRLDGSARRVLISSGLTHPRAIAVDPSRGYLFWSDWDDTFPKIERSYLDGSNRQVLIEFSSKRWPNGVAVDIEAGRVYWAEATSATIESADMETGQNRRVVLSGSFGHIYGFSLLGDNVYWSDRDRRFLGRANKASGDAVNEVHEQMADVRGIKATHTFRLPNYTNECGVNNGNCSHLCLYLPTGRVCMCPVGWELARDGRKCNVPEAFLMFTERGNNDILRVSLSNSRGNLDGLRLMNVTQPIALDYLYGSHKVYWTARQTDNHGGTINRAFMNGSSIERVVQGGIEHPEGLAIDWLAENIYWSDSGHHLIEMADFSGKRRRIIVWKNTHPRALVVHPTAGYLYWADWLNPWRLERSELDGNNRITLLNEVARIFSMTIDLTSGCLFWSQDGPSSIQSINLSSGSRRVIIGERSLQPYVIAEYADRLYWTSWRSHKIESCDKDTGTNRSVLSINPHYIINLVIVHALKQKGWNHCVIKRRQCQSLYVSAPENHCRCACPTHYSLGSDKKSCLPPNTFMLFTQGMGIRRMKIRDRHDTEDHPVMLFPFGEQLNPRSVQYDSYNRTIYWLASTHDSGGYSTVLRRARDDGVNVEDVPLSRVASEEPYDISFEPFSRTLFWSCEATSSINATRLIGGEVRPLGAIVADTEFNPRALTVYAKRRFLFFANFGYRTGIVLCQLDGSLCHFVVADNIMRPEALVFDAHGSRVFWVDSGYKQVSSVDYKGRGRQTIIYNVDYPTGVAVFRQSLYFVDQGVHKIEAVHKQTGTGREAIVERMTGLASVLAVDDELNAAELRRSPCLRKACSHLCLLTNNGTGTYEAICACPSTMVFQSDAGRCVPKIRCNPWEWSCRDGRQCIDRAARCDGVVHCRDGSDESPVCFRCQPNEFECIEEQKCIPRLSYCDGKKDCRDGSDEHCYCPDPANQFYCSDPAGSQSKICIIRAWVCDGVRHCDDGSDESVCTGAQPSPKLGYELRFPTQDPVTYVIVIIVGFGFSAIILLAMYFFCRRPNAPTVQPVEIELVNRTLAPENGNTSALSATVECRYRLGIGKRDSLSNELCQGRTEMTGRTLSSASEDTGIRIGLYVPPPSPVSAGSFTWCSRKSQRRSGSVRQGRCVRLYVQQSSAVLGMAYGGLTASYAKNDTPPPPYTCYSSTLDDGGQSTEDEVGVRIPLIMARENPAPPPPSPRSSGSVASSGPMMGRCQESCSSSSVGNGNSRKKSMMGLRIMENPRNPPPSPDEASDTSESR